MCLFPNSQMSALSTDCVKTQNVFQFSLTYLYDCSNRIDFDERKETYATSMAFISGLTPMILIILVIL